MSEGAPAAVPRSLGSSGVMVVGTLDVEVEEWVRYVASLELLRPREDAAILPLLGEALSDAPIPVPWLLCRGPSGELFFASETTRASSFTHPFYTSLRQLARVCRTVIALPMAPRRKLIDALHEAWEKQVAAEFDKWQVATSETGQEYYYLRDGSAVMWEHPRDVLWPEHCMKLWALDQLSDDSYIMRMLSYPRADVRSSAAEICQHLTDATAAAHAERIAELLADECAWIRSAAAEALLKLGQVEERSAPSTTSSWFSATSRRSTLTIASGGSKISRKTAKSCPI